MTNPKLVCGIIATRGVNTRKKPCDDFKKHWLKIVEKNSKLNDVEFYFLYSSPEVDKITIDGYDFIVPGTESKKNIIRKTVAFFKYIIENKKGCTHVLRTNLSSFYNIPALLDKLQEVKTTDLVFAQLENCLGTPFPSGCGAVYSIDVIEKFCVHFKDGVKDIYKGHRIYDDVIIGEILNKKKIRITNNSYINLHAKSKLLENVREFADKNKLKENPENIMDFKPWLVDFLKEKNHIHYRCSNPEFEYIFLKLFEKYY